MERGGNPVKISRKNAKTPLSSTCHPIALYFYWERLSIRFQKAWRRADVRRSKMARIGIIGVNVS